MELLYGFIIATLIISAYALGVKNGLQMAKGIAPKVISNPIQAILASVKKPPIEPEQSIDDLLGYTAADALKAIKEVAK